MKRSLCSICVCCLGLVWAQMGMAQSQLNNKTQRDTDALARVQQSTARALPLNQNPSNVTSTANFANSGQLNPSWTQATSGRFPQRVPANRNRRQSSLDSSIEKLKQAESEDDKDAAKKEITKELEKQYDVFLAQNEKSLDQLRARLEELEKQLQKRKDAKERLIELKLELLVSQAEGLGWPGESSPSPSVGRSMFRPTTTTNGRTRFANPEPARPAELPANPASPFDESR